MLSIGSWREGAQDHLRLHCGAQRPRMIDGLGEGREGFRGARAQRMAECAVCRDWGNVRAEGCLNTRNEAMGNFYMEVAGRSVGLGCGSERGNLEITSVLMSEVMQPGSEAQPQSASSRRGW